MAVLRRERYGEDEMGEPVYRWQSATVPGCLVRPLDGGEVERLNDGPARSAAAEVLEWTSADGEVTTGPSLSLDARVSGEWTINARFLPDCAVRIRTEVEQQDA